MSENWMTTGMEQGAKKQGSSTVRPEKIARLYVPIETKTKIVLLDDVEDAAQVYEHGVFIQGDKNSMTLKATCVSPDEDPVPTKCRVCNGMIQDERIYRANTLFLSCISLDKFKIEGETYMHIKKLVPLNVKAAKKLIQRKKDLGSLKGAMFSIYRSDQTSPRVGDDWQFIKRVNLVNYFAKSPRLLQMMKKAKKRGETLTPKQALKMLITPFEYREVLKPTKKKVDYFLGYLGLADDQSKEPEEEDEQDIDYAEDDEFNAEEEEDFTEFEGEEEEEEPKPAMKKKKKGKKKGGKGKKKKKKKRSS